MTDAPPTVTVAPVPALPPTGLRQKLLDYVKQPGTQSGYGLILAGIAVASFHPFGPADSYGLAVALIGGGLPKILPDSSTDLIKTRDLSNALAHAALTRAPADIAKAAEQAALDVATVEARR